MPASAAVEREVSYSERLIAVREAIDKMKTATGVVRVAVHMLVDVDCMGSVDVASKPLYELNKALTLLEGQYRDLLGIEAEVPASLREGRELTLVRRTAHKGRRRGVTIIPNTVRIARAEAGMSLAEVAGKAVTRVAIWHIEHGRSRPSMETLEHIAEQTGKPLSYFIEGA